MGNWIQAAIKHPGALREKLGVQTGETIPAKKLADTHKNLSKAAEGPKKLTGSQRKLLKQVNLARTLKSMKN